MAPLHILFLVVLLAVLIGFVELGVLTAAFDKLGLSAHSAYLLLITTLAGSFINVPLFRIRRSHTLARRFRRGSARLFGYPAFRSSPEERSSQ